MANHSFRAAFWALGLSLGLSISLLLSDPETARLAILSVPPPQTPAEDVADTPPISIAVTEPDSARFVESQPVQPVEGAPLIADNLYLAQLEYDAQRATEDIPPAEETPIIETPPLPIREAAAHESTVPPWTLVAAPDRQATSGRFEELPPPPEYTAAASDEPLPPLAVLSPETLDQLAGIGASLDGLRGELLAVRESQQSVERSLHELAAAASNPEPPTVVEAVELRATIVHVSRTGALHEGVLRALARDLGDNAVQVDTAGSDIAWGVCRGGTEQVTGWLRGRASLDRMAVRTLRLLPGVSGSLDLWRLLPPRMVQARGTTVFERLPQPVWGAGLELRWQPDSTGDLALEFQAGADFDDAGWRRVIVGDGDTLVLTGLLAHAPPAPYGPGDGGPAHEQIIGESEVVVVISPRKTPAEPATSEAPALLSPALIAQ
jgi:hypothetical protein